MPVTVTQIAEKLGENRDRVKYAISRAGVTPIGKAGNVNLYRNGDVSRIRSTLATMARFVRPAVESVAV